MTDPNTDRSAEPCENRPATDEPDGGTTDRTVLTRRRLLAAGGGLLGVAGGGGVYAYRTLQGDDGDYVAPAGFPVVTTRGSFDEDGSRTGEQPTVQSEGNWPADDGPIVVFVHGLNTSHEGALNQAYTAERGLATTPLSLPIVAFSWDSERDWSVARRIAERNGPLLADWLREWPATGNPQVHVFAYSLGARVTCEALRVLAADGHTDVVESVSLLGGAIPHDSVEIGGRYGDAIETAAPIVANFHSRNDRVLAWLYRIGDRTRAVGHGGIRDPDAAPDSYLDVDVTDLVGDHYSYYQPGEGCLPRLVETIR